MCALNNGKKARRDVLLSCLPSSLLHSSLRMEVTDTFQIWYERGVLVALTIYALLNSR